MLLLGRFLAINVQICLEIVLMVALEGEDEDYGSSC